MPEDEMLLGERREGSRWYNARPSGEEVAEWFQTVKLHDGMDHADFVSGITLIETTEQRRVVVGNRGDGTSLIQDVEELVYTPYPRVEARIAYFWKYLALHPELRGRIEPIGDDEGFFEREATETGGKVVTLVGRRMRVRVFDRNDQDLNDYPSEVKTVLLVNRHGSVDADAYSKASTGAIGRALGVAGMLVLPGTGVATAEDMREVQGTTPTREGVRGLAEALRAAEDPAETDAEKLAALTEALTKLATTDQREAVNDWWAQRQLPGVEALLPDQVDAALLKTAALLKDALPVGASVADA